jgi:DeoR/GlpR family transcriptional regulator of sugar metabolism
MSRSPRHDKILQLVRENGFMPIEELARLLDVTPQTIRRDINQLCEENLLRRYTVVLPWAAAWRTRITLRAKENSRAKRHILPT